MIADKLTMPLLYPSELLSKGSRRNNFTFWRESRWSIMNRFLLAKHAEDRAPSGCGPQARWLCCSLLTYRAGYASSLAPRQQAWGPAAECELISARTLRTTAGSICSLLRLEIALRDCLVSACLDRQHFDPVFRTRLEEFRRNRYLRYGGGDGDAKWEQWLRFQSFDDDLIADNCDR
jgi:hypothetical protein